ncbi:MAG: GAF domain-containing protein [Euryarchaeota archaeon]|nr:GAF domain-containing protein [Euryarchaeota archaeon]MBU4607981.1 GAF domain-containing protein [Euryarchaeota archaeon]MBV1730339.1 GAF domain-containing protein [Methanobacterium sp.]MBV1754909.1 GAF domain-containing protein [Methanobacterium sp.]
MSKTKVMVVEDESIVAIDIGQRLESLGYEVTATVSSGEKAIEKAQETSPDIILMDIVLKGKMDGIEAASIISERFNIPIVYLTAYSDEKTLKRAKITGPFGYIIKPFEDRELHSVIEVALYKYEMDIKLKKSEQLYRIMVNSMNDILFTLDLDEKCTMISEPQVKRYGLIKDQFIGKTPLEIFGDEGRIHHDHNLKVLQGESVVYEWSTHFTGEKLYFQTSISPLKNEKDEIIGIVGLFRDVSDLKEAKKALSWELNVNNSLAELSQKLLNPISLEEISKNVLNYAVSLTGSQFCFVGYVEPGTKNLKSFSVTPELYEKCHVSDIFSTEFCFNDVGELWGWVLDNKEPLMTNDPSNDPRSIGTPEGHVKINKFLSAPAIMDGELVGQIALANAEEPYQDHDLELVKRLANLYALAVHRKLSENKIKASEEKNRRIVEKFLKIVSEVLTEIK